MEDKPPPSAPRTDDADEAKQQQRSSVMPNEDDAAAGAPASQQPDDQPSVDDDDTKPSPETKKQEYQPLSSEDATMETPASKPQDASGDAEPSDDNGPAKLKGEAQDVTDALVNAKREKVDSVKKDAAKDHASNPKKKRAKAKDGAPKAKKKTGGDTKKRKGTAKKKPTVEHGYIGVTSRVGVAVQDIGMPFSGGYTRRRVQHEASIKRGGREYSLGAFELAADAALAHDAAYRITADDGHGGALATNDAEGIQRAIGWLDRKPTKKGKEREEEGVNFRRPSEYRAARKKELKDSGFTADVVPAEEGLKLLIGKEVLNLAKAYVATRGGTTREGGDQSDEGCEQPQTKKRKGASSLSKKKTYTPDHNLEDNEDDVKVQAEMLLSLQNKSVGVNKKDALARKLERMMAGGESEESPAPVAASSGASDSVLASSAGLSQSLLGLGGGQGDAISLQHALLLFQQRQAALQQQRALEEQLVALVSRRADNEVALPLAVRESVGAMFGPRPTAVVAAPKSTAESKPEAETEAETKGETKPEFSQADADNNGDDAEDAKVKSLLAKMGFKGPVLPGLAKQLKAATKGIPDIMSTDALDEDDDPQAARERRALKETKREALAQKLSVLMGGGSNVESSGAQGDDRGEASASVAPNLERQQAVQLQALQSLQGLSREATSAGVGEHSLMQSLLLKKQLAEMNKAALEQKITSSLDDLALPQGLQSIRNQQPEQRPTDSQTTGDDALMEEAVRRRVMLELRSQLGGGSYLGAAPGLGSGMTFGAERAARMTNADLRRALMLSQMQAAAVEQRLELERRSREMWQQASTAKGPSSLDVLVEVARKSGDEAG